MPTDLRSPTLMYLKAVMFVLAGSLAAGLVVLEHPTLKVAGLLAVAVWCFCRAYYFAFYVVQHYIDPGHRYAGLGAFAAYVVRRRRRTEDQPGGRLPVPSPGTPGEG